MKLFKRCLAIVISVAMAISFSACRSERITHGPITDASNLQNRVIGVPIGWDVDYILTSRDDLTLKRYDSVADSAMALCYAQVDAIARCLTMHPYVIFFDEPTSALDPTMVDEVENVIKKLIKDGMTSVIVTHEMRFARNVATKVVFLAEQGIYEMGTANQIFDHPSKDLTRKFLYRARMFEQAITPNTDYYSLRSDIKAFAVPYGFSKRQDKALSYYLDELLIPIMNSGFDNANVRFVCSDVDGKHKLYVSFSNMQQNPLEHPAVDEIGLKIWNLYTSSYSSSINGNGDWEVEILLD